MSGAVAIVAMADNGVIGRGGTLPWRLPDDLRRFRLLTTGQVVVMGRRTFESIGRPLPGRRNLVLSRDPGWRAPGCESFAGIEAALAAADSDRIPFVIGGAEVFSAAWKYVARLELTEVHAEIAGDTRLSGFARGEWQEVFRERHDVDARHAFAFSFVTLRRR